MLNYILICISVVCFTAQFAFSKIYQRSAKQTLTTALIMLTVMSTFGTVLFLCISGFKVRFTAFGAIMALCLGALLLPYHTIGIKVLSLGSLAIYSMFMMLGGMAVPFLYGIIFLSEPVSVGKIVGCVLLTFFIVLQAFSQKRGDEKKESSDASKGKKVLFFALCVVIFLINGSVSVISNVHQINASAMDELSFMFTSCAVTAVLAALFLAVLTLKNGKTKVGEELKPVLKVKPVLAMLAIGFANYAGNLLQLMAASKVPASVQFPLVSGGTIVLSALASALIFKEKLSKKEWISIAGAFVATFLFAF